MKTIDQISFANKRALIRVDFNVPLNDQYQITDDSRIRAAVPTITKILKDGGSVVLMSHLGRPKNGPEEKFSLKHLVKHLSDVFKTQVFFAENCIGSEAKEKAEQLSSGEILLLENLRFHKEETKGDEGFAKALAGLGDVYVNDAFGTAHRAHASTAVIADNFPEARYFGYIMAGEIANAEKVMNDTARPFTAIVGGAKVSDKLLIIENLLNIADNILIGGGMAYTFIKGMGGTIGNSLVEDDRVELTQSLLKKAEAKGVKLILPQDSVVADQFSNEANTQVSDNMTIADGWMGLDIGPEAAKDYTDVIANSKTILWNGPMGVFEMDKFQEGTRAVAESVAKATDSGAFSLIGGGDSAAAIHKFNYGNDVSYVSTGGGALLEYFEGKELPGIKAING